MDKLKHCARDFLAFVEEQCPTCGAAGLPLQEDDPIYVGELPGPLRNAMQIAFSASEIPFTALPNQGVGFTMSAGDIFESYRIYVPYERSQEALEALNTVLENYRH